MVVTLVAGIGLVLAGLLAIGYGIQYKEFSVGSTLIQSGVVGACTGLILIGLWMAVRELKAAAQRLGGALPAHPPAQMPLEPAIPVPRGAAAARDSGFLFTRDQPAAESPAGTGPAAPAAPPPWHEEAASRARGEAQAAPAEAAPKRRNLLFSSSSRKERERAEARASEPLTPDLLSPELRPNPPEPPPAPAAGEAQPATFEAAWPRADRLKPAELPRRSPRTPSTFSEGDSPSAAPAVPAPERHPPAPREEQPPVTVLKSGVVDGMAYSLYSDGSIEAQMPEGMMRFASIDELRLHLDQRS